MKRRSLVGLLMAVSALAQNRLPGELEPYQKVSVEARVAGIVEKVLVDRGSVVKAGQLLVELQAPELQAKIAEALAQAVAVEAQKAEIEARRAAQSALLERTRKAAATPGAVAASDIEQLEQQVKSLEGLLAATEKSAAARRAQAQVLKEMAGFLEIRAPFDGVITERHVHPGALAQGPLVELQQVARLRLVVAVPEAELGRVKPGQRWSFTVPAQAGRVFAGTVARLARSLDAKTRTMPVELDVMNGDEALAPGMYAEVEWKKP